MKAYQQIQIEISGTVATLWLNRPGKHNSLNPELMNEVIHYLNSVESNAALQVIILRGKGKSFCAGADLKWMQDSANLSDEANLKDSQLLTDFYSAVYHSSKITIAVAHGNIYGGGNGLVAACDLAYGLADTRFSLSETRLGLIAASITPYMLKRLQMSVYKELIFTAKIFSGRDAELFGLINKAFTLESALESYLENTISAICSAGPNSLMGSKKLIQDILDPSVSEKVLRNIPDLLANVRVSPEAKEGFAAFLEKRNPNWIR